MTNAEDTLSDEGKAPAPEHTGNGVPVSDTAEPGFDSATPGADQSRLDHRHRRHLGRLQTTGGRERTLDRWTRGRILAGSLIGSGCLMLALLQPDEGSPFAGPSGPVAWIELIAGIIGIWLVPGLWLSALMMRTGIGPVARLATRIGATLAWYALVGPVIHVSADGALVTPGGIVGTTVAATAAVCLGVALGLVRQPADPRLRFVIAGLIGGICAQTVIWLSMLFFADGVNYEQIRRMDWLILLACASLTAIGAHSRPDLPVVRTVKNIRPVLISLAVVAVTAAALLATGSMWSPAQRMPSAIGAEQVAAPPGSDVAFALTALGPNGPALLRRADFAAADDTGRAVPVSTRLVQGGTADAGTLLLVLDPVSRTQLCDFTAPKPGNSVSALDGSEQGSPAKLTVRDKYSGMLVQALIPAEWCAG
jgi:hypothetical protein